MVTFRRLTEMQSYRRPNQNDTENLESECCCLLIPGIKRSWGNCQKPTFSWGDWKRLACAGEISPDRHLRKMRFKLLKGEFWWGRGLCIHSTTHTGCHLGQASQRVINILTRAQVCFEREAVWACLDRGARYSWKKSGLHVYIIYRVQSSLFSGTVSGKTSFVWKLDSGFIKGEVTWKLFRQRGARISSRRC